MRGYLAYLLMACLSETVNQVVFGFHATRTTMIMVSLLFGAYIVARRKVFLPRATPPGWMVSHTGRPESSSSLSKVS